MMLDRKINPSALCPICARISGETIVLDQRTIEPIAYRFIMAPMLDSQHADAAEIDKFETQAAYWWDPKGPFKPLHDINPVRLDYIKRHTSVTGRKLLDVGCGGGRRHR